MPSEHHLGVHQVIESYFQGTLTTHYDWKLLEFKSLDSLLSPVFCNQWPSENHEQQGWGGSFKLRYIQHSPHCQFKTLYRKELLPIEFSKPELGREINFQKVAQRKFYLQTLPKFVKTSKMMNFCSSKLTWPSRTIQSKWKIVQKITSMWSRPQSVSKRASES